MATTTNPDHPLTDKQQNFVKEYLVDLCASKAALRAGYSDPTYGRELKRKPHVFAAIIKAKERRNKETNIDVNYVVEQLVSTYTDARVCDDLGPATRCLELLGRHVGAFEKDNGQKAGKIIFLQNFAYDPKVKDLPPGSQLLEIQADDTP